MTKHIMTFFLLLCQRFYADTTNSYFLIGDNEDGCDIDQLKYCACILKLNANEYCGHLEQWPVYCQPNAKPDQCIDGNLFYTGNHSQEMCISEVFQSIQSKLPSVDENFCKKNNVTICNPMGLNCT